MQLFTGPGKYLIVPYSYRAYSRHNCPICKENIKCGLPKYTYAPHWKILTKKVYFGEWYEVTANKKIITRPWTSKEAKNWLKEQK